MVRDKDVKKPSRSCDEPGRPRFCWLGNLQGAGAFAAKQACSSRGELERQWRLRSGTGLTWQAWPAQLVGNLQVGNLGARRPSNRHGSHREPHTIRARCQLQANSDETEGPDGQKCLSVL
jgi:hypothetical protein